MQKKKIEQYTIFLDKKLGQGSFGTVYLGQQDATKALVAVKMLPKKIINKDDYIKDAIYSEIHILKSLKSEYIVGCLDVMESSNYFYILQEYCNEGELRGLLNRKGSLPEKQALDILTQICWGFVCMLNEGVIHRDLKPENILIHNGVFKICDFGFSKKLKDKRMKNNSVVGTPLYMAIQILKSQSYTSKCDIWALGFIFYEMLHGTTPWKATSEHQLIKNIETKPLKITAKISEQCHDLLSRMLKVRERDRIDWDNLLCHQIFKGKFANYHKKAQQFQNKLKYLMGELRYCIKAQNIDLEKLFNKMGYQRNTELNFKHFREFMKTIDSTLTPEEQQFFFSKMDTKMSNTVSLADLQTQMSQYNIPLKSKYQPIEKTESFTTGNRKGKDGTTLDPEVKIVAAFLRLSMKLQKKNITLFQVFNAYDVNKDGILTLNQFRKIMKKLDSTLTDTEMELAFSLVDRDKSSTLNFNEFYQYFCKCVGEPANNYMTKR